MTSALLLEDFGILCARELFPLWYLHHIGIDFPPVSIGIQEVESATAAAPKGVPRAVPPLWPMDQGPLHNLDALAPQVRQGLQPLVAIGYLQRDVLQGVVACITVFV